MGENIAFQPPPEPTEPGFYIYTGGCQNMVFLLVKGYLPPGQQWYALFDNGTFDKCHWGYIEQSLSVYELKRLDEIMKKEVHSGVINDL